MALPGARFGGLRFCPQSKDHFHCREPRCVRTTPRPCPRGVLATAILRWSTTLPAESPIRTLLASGLNPVHVAPGAEKLIAGPENGLHTLHLLTHPKHPSDLVKRPAKAVCGPVGTAAWASAACTSRDPSGARARRSTCDSARRRPSRDFATARPAHAQSCARVLDSSLAMSCRALPYFGSPRLSGVDLCCLALFWPVSSRLALPCLAFSSCLQ